MDRDSASRLGLTEIQIDNALGDAFAQAQVSNIYNPFSPQQYHVVMEVAPEFWQNPDVLKELYVSTSGGAVAARRPPRRSRAPRAQPGRIEGVASTRRRRRGCGAQSGGEFAGECGPRQHLHRLRGERRPGDRRALRGVQPLRHRTTPVSVNHTGTSVSTSIAFNLPVGESLDIALAAIERKMSEIHVPVGIIGGTYGTARLFQQSSSNTPIMLVAALIAIYVVLGVLYESYSQPITILSTLSSAGLGALLALMATGTEFSLIAFLGILLLIGIVKKNAIMMVDFALEAERTLGMDPRAAIAHACSLRFRPIMMTTCAAIAGRAAAGHRLRRRHGNAPALGNFHRRRPDRQPGSYALYDPGGLLVRPSLLEALETRQVQAAAGRAAGGESERPGFGPLGSRHLMHKPSAPLVRLRFCGWSPSPQRPRSPPPARSVPTTIAASSTRRRNYKEAGDWKPSEPNDVLTRGPWWEIYKDDD